MIEQFTFNWDVTTKIAYWRAYELKFYNILYKFVLCFSKII